MKPNRVTWIVILLVTLFCGIRAWSSHEVPGDFLRYHRAARLVATGKAELLYDTQYLEGQHVYEHERAEEARSKGDRADSLVEASYKYLPATAVMMSPLGALHPRLANAFWGAWNGFLVCVLCFVSWRFCGGGRRWPWMLVPGVVLFRAALDNVNLGQLNPSAIVPATVALVLLHHRRDRSAGLLLAFGSVVKFMPVFLAPWLLIKRRFAALGFLLLGILGIGWGVPATVLGPARATDLTIEYAAVRSSEYTSAHRPQFPGHSIKSFVYRTFGGTPFITGPEGPKRIVMDVSVARLPPGLLYWSVIGLAAAVYTLVLWRARGPLRQPGDPRAPPEIGAALAVLLLISPEARDPHFLYLGFGGVALTFALLRCPPESRWRDSRFRLAVGLSVVGAMLVNSSSTSLLGRVAAAYASAVCGMGFGAAAWLAALLLVPSGAPGTEPPPAQARKVRISGP